MTHDVLVIGGGISGLTVAHNLMQRGRDVQVLERQVRVGGNAQTDRFDGFLMVHGPTTFNASVPAAFNQITKLGLFMGDAHQLSINGAFPKLAELEQKFGSITRGILQAKRGSEPGRHLYSWENGIGTIPQTHATNLGARVHLGVGVTKICKTLSGFGVQTTEGTRNCHAVVLAVQPHVAAMLLENLDPISASAVGEIAAPPINVMFFGYRRDQVGHPLDGLGFLGTKDDSCIISGAQFASTMYAGRAPAGYVSISAYAGGARNPELTKVSDADLLAITHKELAKILEIKGDPVITRTRRWPLGLPQYTLGHRARREVIETVNERVSGLFLTGNYLRGVSVANCMDIATQIAATVDQCLSASETINAGFEADLEMKSRP
ncbi:MAG: protoporphyrinogen oxidase [Alphaproteobacteria bacterium]